MKLSKCDLQTPLKDEWPGVSQALSGARLRSLLVVAEVSLSFVLLTGAGLLARSYWRLEQVPLGVNPQRVLTMGVSLPPAKYPEPHQKTAFYDEVLQRVNALPGVQSAAITLGLPLSISLMTQVLKEGRSEGADGERLAAVWTPISPDYFRTLGIPLLKGRIFNERDRANAPNVVVISERLARQLWPYEEPLGKRIVVSRNSQPSEVIGVVGEVKNNKLEADSLLQIYTPYPQRPWPSMSLVIRTTGEPLSMATAVRNQVLAVDKDQPVTGVQTMEQIIASSKSQSRFTTQLISSLALVALILAAFGIYGVMAFSVEQRTHEIGIRIALGARAGAVLRLLISQGMILSLLGVGLGLGGAWALTRLIRELLFGVSAADPLTFAVIAVLLAGVALLACYIPARRATKVDPMTALRHE
jgi:putative ABC transport system permease protein